MTVRETQGNRRLYSETIRQLVLDRLLGLSSYNLRAFQLSFHQSDKSSKTRRQL